ncbi:MAG: hypothetical protein CM15mV25_1190 [uncultured marine virus]|nr:MAG: hypothetical protein CM15mV25_1190 [uncultured marine virus]
MLKKQKVRFQKGDKRLKQIKITTNYLIVKRWSRKTVDTMAGKRKTTNNIVGTYFFEEDQTD